MSADCRCEEVTACKERSDELHLHTSLKRHGVAIYEICARRAFVLGQPLPRMLRCSRSVQCRNLHEH